MPVGVRVPPPAPLSRKGLRPENPRRAINLVLAQLGLNRGPQPSFGNRGGTVLTDAPAPCACAGRATGTGQPRPVGSGYEPGETGERATVRDPARCFGGNSRLCAARTFWSALRPVLISHSPARNRARRRRASNSHRPDVVGLPISQARAPKAAISAMRTPPYSRTIAATTFTRSRSSISAHTVSWRVNGDNPSGHWGAAVGIGGGYSQSLGRRRGGMPVRSGPSKRFGSRTTSRSPSTYRSCSTKASAVLPSPERTHRGLEPMQDGRLPRIGRARTRCGRRES